MSLELFSRNHDLARLRQEGYSVQVVQGHLLMRDVPYVNAEGKVLRGTLISTLMLSAAGETVCPETHVINWDGEFPCFSDGKPISALRHNSGNIDLGHGLLAKHSFSCKPQEGYPDYYKKMSNYAAIISGPAFGLDPTASPRVFREPDDFDESSVFNYEDTATVRAGIGSLSQKLEGEVISVIGVGGTGGYILDLVAKTPVREIRLFDADEFKQHNAFRAPGAPTLDELKSTPMKVEYLKGIYSRMHRRIVSHPVRLTSENVGLLEGTTFAFISMDGGEDKRAIIGWLEGRGIPFIDVGMGLEFIDGHLFGILRVTAGTDEWKRGQAGGRIAFSGGGDRDVYSTNIQVADLNALNAALAVVKWKKLRGFYYDHRREHHCTYTIDGNEIGNEDPRDDQSAA